MILSGKEVAEAINQTLNCNHSPKLATIRVGEDPADIAYETSAKKKLENLGLSVETVVLPATITQEELNAVIVAQNENTAVHGILVFQPLPKHLSALHLPIAPEKDVDCTTLLSQGKLVAGLDGFKAGAPAAVMATLAHFNIPLEGKNIALIGRSSVVGKPLALLLIQGGATVTICHSKTKNLPQIAKASDILITSAGKANFITPDFVHPEQVVIDVSTNVVEGKLCGDLSPEVHDLVHAYTPTPGGIGAVTTSILAQQVVKASQG